MKHIKTQILFLLLFILNGLTVFSQVSNFKVYNEDNGLPQNYIYSISQSKDGFLYLSTGDGFAAFEGNKFKTYTTKDSLCENFVTIHFTDSRNLTWLGHYQNGISYLSGQTFFKIKGSDQFGSKITSFAEDKKKNIWFSVQGKGVFYIDTAFTIQHPKFPDDLNVNCICVDPSGSLLCGTDNGLIWYDIDDASKPRMICSQPELVNKSVKFILQDAMNPDCFWAAIPGDGVYGAIREKNCFKISAVISAELKSPAKNITSIYSDHTGNLWISLADEGLKKVVFAGLNRESYSLQSIGKKNGLPNLYVQSIFEDYEGNMWFGTFGGGLIQLPVESFSFFKPELSPDVRSILIDPDGTLFVGTSNGLLQYNITDEEQSKLYDTKNGFVKDIVNVVFRDKSGIIWLGTEQNGIYTFDSKSGKFENFSKKNKLTIPSINCFTESKDGQIIIGTKEGVYFYTPSTGKIVLVSTLEGLLHNDVIHLFCDSKNRIWFSSHGTPPYYMEKNEFTALKDIPELKTFDINCISEDKNGLIWIASEGDGVFYFDGSKTKNFRVDQGLLSNFCYSIICSKENEVWITHKNGLSCIRRVGASIVHYGKSDGLLFTENNLNAGFKDIKGNLWFGTSEGIIKYDFDQSMVRKTEPMTKILLLTLNGKSYTTDNTIELPFGNYSTRLDYIGISLTDPSKVNYQYRLLGLDSTWRYANDRFIEYSKIADGNYTFQVLACNRDGIWNATPAEISFTIGLPVWKKVWFWFLAGIVFITISFLLVRMRTQSLIKTKQVLEKKVEVKTLQLRQEKEQLEKIKIILEEKDKDITDSINYAKRIQESLLPSKENLLECFPKTFIYYKPRDIVSGDFYWFAETEDQYIAAVVDCTGHGIPGAFMSLIGSTLMNEIVNSKKITTPSKILAELHNNVVKALRQDTEVDSSRDGMDLSICSINKAKTKMIFSSAGRPMYYVRNGELTEVNLRSYSIGGSYEDFEKIYTDLEIDILPDDIFYFFSDGFSDQFDRNNQKKFSSKRLKQLLTDISGMSPAEQLMEIDIAYIAWKGGQRQIDDITIVGIKI